MSATALRVERTKNQTSVLTFPRLHAQPTETEALSSPNPQSLEFFENFKAALDTYVTESYVRQILSGLNTADSPFDAVYISSLTPDPIKDTDLARMRSFASIRDLSDTIAFSDGWDD